MTRRLDARLSRLEARCPPPPAPRDPDVPSPDELRQMSNEQLLARLEARFNTPEALARQDELEAMSDEELLAVWARRP